MQMLRSYNDTTFFLKYNFSAMDSHSIILELLMNILFILVLAAAAAIHVATILSDGQLMAKLLVSVRFTVISVGK